ncbi:MAG: hypothetical protein NVS3B1_16430 [Marmoricola sp.]
MIANDMSRAVAAARGHVGAPDDAPTSWRIVNRLDNQPAYLLVGISTDTTGWVVAVGFDGDLKSRATDAAGAQAWWVDVPEELVWDSAATRSMLYPARRSGDGLIDYAGKVVCGGQDPRG